MIPVAQLSMIRVVPPLELALSVGDASPAAVSSLSAPTTSSSRVPPLNANGMSRSISNEMTVMSKLEALESSWDFSVLHAELDVICPLADNDDVLWVC